MNKMIKGLLVTVLTVGATHAHDHTNQTFLMPRPTGVDLPMEYTIFDELVTRKAEKKFGGNFQVVPFYKDSSDSDQAEYFLTKNKSTLTFSAVRTDNNTRVPNDGADLDAWYLVHDHGRATDALAKADLGDTTIGLDPEQRSYGVRIDYHQDLDKLLNGLYLKVNLPVVHVENDPGLTIRSSSADSKGYFEQYFRGDYERESVAPVLWNGNAQSKLTHAKIAGKQSETGLADIDVALGYKFLNKENYHVALALAITIPTGNDADGNYMFEPIVGNGGHFGLGFDVCGDVRVWGTLQHNIKLLIKMKYRYLFESNETRTFGLNGRHMGQYFLLGKVGTAAGGKLIPAANITTLDADVTPGSQFDGILGFAYNNGGFTVDLGYNLYHREGEDTHRKGNITDVYYVAARNFDTANPFTANILNVDGNVLANALVDNNALDVNAAATPSQCTHSIFGGFGYSFKEWKTPLMLGLGGKYEFASQNSAIEQWGIWGKIGIGF